MDQSQSRTSRTSNFFSRISKDRYFGQKLIQTVVPTTRGTRPVTTVRRADALATSENIAQIVQSYAHTCIQGHHTWHAVHARMHACTHARFGVREHACMRVPMHAIGAYGSKPQAPCGSPTSTGTATSFAPTDQCTHAPVVQSMRRRR